jgi:transcription termination/antitermination protein NusG
MDQNRKWYALYVKSRHEYVTQGELVQKGIDTFLPSVKKLRQWKDRKKFVDFPLFPGYLFVYMFESSEEYINVLRTRGVVRLLSTGMNRPTPVSSEEINTLKLLIESGQHLDVYPHLKEGNPVRIRRGPLSGAVGIINNRVDQSIFVVNVDILGRSVGVNIYADDIELN